MKYIIYKHINQMFLGWTYERIELKDDKALKDYLFKNRDELSHIEIFDGKSKCNIKIDININ